MILNHYLHYVRTKSITNYKLVTIVDEYGELSLDDGKKHQYSEYFFHRRKY